MACGGQHLGELTPVGELLYTGGLDCNPPYPDGKLALVFSDATSTILFHTPLLMASLPATATPSIAPFAPMPGSISTGVATGIGQRAAAGSAAGTEAGAGSTTDASSPSRRLATPSSPEAAAVSAVATKDTDQPGPGTVRHEVLPMASKNPLARDLLLPGQDCRVERSAVAESALPAAAVSEGLKCEREIEQDATVMEERSSLSELVDYLSALASAATSPFGSVSEEASMATCDYAGDYMMRGGYGWGDAGARPSGSYPSSPSNVINGGGGGGGGNGGGNGDAGLDRLTAAATI